MLPGVYETKKKNGAIYYRAGISYRGRHISLGSSADAAVAGAMFQEAHLLTEVGAITIHNFNSYIQHLSFDKAVSLLNFRDFGIYIKTPIYLQKSCFLYFLTPDQILKFDKDDLFFYSSHRIIQRQGHLYVNDYGMQCSIAARYGIKNFAVAGRDYLFVNGDPLDFRYANIKVISHYHGVTCVRENIATWYEARIHLKNQWMIGRYSTEVRAAVAYNKAVDYARDHGFQKKFTENYITELSPGAYADMYTGIHLPQRLTSYIDTLGKG
jgi:hypothetical protein